MRDYPAPVAKLLELGLSVLRQRGEWPNYLALGLEREHIPDLIRLVETWTPEDADDEIDWDATPSWAPAHAWRALGQLQAAEAVETLFEIVRLERETDCSDWAGSEMPFVYGKMGPGALPRLARLLKDREIDDDLRWIVSEGISEIGKHHPEARNECVALLTAQLETSGDNDEEFNGGLVAGLLDLKAVESAPVIEGAFAAEHVAEWIAGDWETVRYELGLGPPPDPNRPPRWEWVGTTEPAPRPAPARTPKMRAEERSRNRKKQANQSKKRNRKKK